jgi:hypothetical protein
MTRFANDLVISAKRRPKINIPSITIGGNTEAFVQHLTKAMLTPIVDTTNSMAALTCTVKTTAAEVQQLAGGVQKEVATK